MNTVDKILNSIPVDKQFELAKKLASNCGYKLVEEDNERSLEIKECIAKINRGYGGLPVVDRKLIIEGLERLLNA